MRATGRVLEFGVIAQAVTKGRCEGKTRRSRDVRTDATADMNVTHTKPIGTIASSDKRSGVR